MQGLPPVGFNASEAGLFSTDEILQLMRVERERAARYGYPITLMLIEVDRLEALHDLYGFESMQEVLRSAVRLVRSTIRQSDFVGVLQDHRMLVLFPHAARETVSAIATRLLHGCQVLEFQSDGRLLRPTISIGAATVSPGESLEFERFLQAVEEALAFAIDSGGDRFVHRQTAGAVIEELRRELEQRKSTLRSGPRSAAATAKTPQKTPELPYAKIEAEAGLEERIRALFRAFGEHSPELRRLEEEVIRAAEEGLRLLQHRDSATAPVNVRHADVLERRIQKLSELLDATEVELISLARRKGVDPGIASIYRTVQGLRTEEADFARKREILTLIFEANLELKQKSKKRT